MEITKENLINEFGMQEGNNPIFPLEKYLPKHKISICVTRINNAPQLCILTINDVLYINPSTIEELQLIEKSLAGVEEQ